MKIIYSRHPTFRKLIYGRWQQPPPTYIIKENIIGRYYIYLRKLLNTCSFIHSVVSMHWKWKWCSWVWWK